MYPATGEVIEPYCLENLFQILTRLESTMYPATGGERKLGWEQQVCRRFSLTEIQSATQDFNDALIIGQGGFGKVYKGEIKNGVGGITFAAVKRLDSTSNQGAPEFWVEIEMLSKLRHCHLVSLIGYCNDNPEMILVYEYVPQGTLDYYLHKDAISLSWVQRLKICIGAARGLDYLHTGTGTQHGVIHRDVKSSNILLDENWDAKISDFGLSKIGPTNQSDTHVSTFVKGTFGYVDPEYFSTGRLTRKSDVYAFGVVLLEALCGRRAVDTSLHEEQWGLAGWAQDCIKEGKLDKIIDSSLKGEISLDSLKEFSRIADSCLHSRPKQRPTMTEVVAKLERTLCLQEKMGPLANKMTFIGKMRSLFSAKSDLKFDRRPVPPLATVVDSSVKAGKARAELVLFNSSFVLTFENLSRSSAELIYKSVYWTTYKVYIEEYGYQVLLKRKNGYVPFKIEENELAALGKACHPNVLVLAGYYWSHEEKFCLYEFMPNGSVASLLHTRETRSTIKWQGRLNIMMGIARGISYLHIMENIVHGNLTSSNVFLDKYYNPLISDVGLLPLVNTGANTRTGNHAPEFLEGECANKSTDVYSLGVIMLELLTGNSTGEGTYMPDLPQWVNVKMRLQLDELFDFQLMKDSTFIKDELLRALNLAMLCIQTIPTDRPEVQQVLQKLEEIEPAWPPSIDV